MNNNSQPSNEDNTPSTPPRSPRTYNEHMRQALDIHAQRAAAKAAKRAANKAAGIDSELHRFSEELARQLLFSDPITQNCKPLNDWKPKKDEFDDDKPNSGENNNQPTFLMT